MPGFPPVAKQVDTNIRNLGTKRWQRVARPVGPTSGWRSASATVACQRGSTEGGGVHVGAPSGGEELEGDHQCVPATRHAVRHGRYILKPILGSDYHSSGKRMAGLASGGEVLPIDAGALIQRSVRVSPRPGLVHKYHRAMAAAS